MNLRDHTMDKPNRVSQIKSKFILALCYGALYPCVILRPAKCIEDGLLVYFFHTQQETEVSSSCVIGNLQALVDHEVSYKFNGNVHCGQVVATDATGHEDDGTLPMNFFISDNSKTLWVSLPNIFLNQQQYMNFF